MATINGTNAANGLNGTGQADQIFGLGGNDVIVAYDGDDLLEGGKGADQLFGSGGFDTASYRSSATGVHVDLYRAEAVGGDATGDQLFGIEALIGSAFGDDLRGDDAANSLQGGGGADLLLGYAEDDALDGGGGDDVLDGGDGNDRLLGGGGNDLLYGSRGNDELRGGAGVDTVLFDGPAMLVDLQTGHATAGEPADGDALDIDSLSGIENVTGSNAGDLIGGDGAANVLVGRGGLDWLAGRGGADRFTYYGTGDSTAKGADTIADFSRAEGDRIDLSAIDANALAAGNQAFRFIGDAPFTGVGQLQFYHANGDTFIEANTTDATPGAELRIVLDGLYTPRAGDFLL